MDIEVPVASPRLLDDFGDGVGHIFPAHDAALTTPITQIVIGVRQRSNQAVSEWLAPARRQGVPRQTGGYKAKK